MAWFGKSENIARDLLIALVISLVFYVTAFNLIEHRRVMKGPWEVAFESDEKGQPAIVITQRTLGISQKVEFPGEHIDRTNLDVAVQFREAVKDLPFGEMVFQDPLYLPGTATMRLFGHVVELMPRVLVIDDQEQAWGTGREIVLKRRPG